MMGLIGILIAMVVNIFLGSTMMTMIISAAAVIVFTGLTAYDTQALVKAYDTSDIDRSMTMGALTLYLDAINLFYNILILLGAPKKD